MARKGDPSDFDRFLRVWSRRRFLTTLTASAAWGAFVVGGNPLLDAHRGAILGPVHPQGSDRKLAGQAARGGGLGQHELA